MAPGLCSFRNESSWPVNGRTGRSFDVTIPATLLTSTAFDSPAAQVRATASPKSNPSTASVKSLMKLRRRSSPSVNSSKPSSFCLSSMRRMCLSSSAFKRPGSPVAFPRASSRSGGRRKLPTWSARYSFAIVFLLRSDSNPELLVDRQPLLPAVADIVIDEPEDVESLDQIVIIVDELQGPVEPEYRLHPVGVVGNQSVYGPRTFLHVAPGPGDPVVFQVPPAPLQRARENPAAMPVPVQPSTLFHPKNVCVHVVPDIERQVTDEYILNIRNVRRLILARPDMNVRERIFAYHGVEVAWCLCG